MMRTRRSSVGRGLVLASAMSLALAGCGGGDGTTGQPASQDPTKAAPITQPPTTSADPLEGDWHTEFTCEESLGAIRSRLSEKVILDQVGSWGDIMEMWGGEPTNDDPCQGATGTAALVARFADGSLALCDAKTGGCEVHATYELVDDRSITVNDPEDNLCPCPGTWQFEIAGDQLTFHVEPNAWIVGTWEAAPWTRES